MKKNYLLLFSFLLLNTAFANNFVHCPAVHELQYNEQEKYYYSEKQGINWQSEPKDKYSEPMLFSSATAKGDQSQRLVTNVECSYFVLGIEEEFSVKSIKLPGNHSLYAPEFTWRWNQEDPKASCMGFRAVENCMLLSTQS